MDRYTTPDLLSPVFCSRGQNIEDQRHNESEGRLAKEAVYRTSAPGLLFALVSPEVQTGEER